MSFFWYVEQGAHKSDNVCVVAVKMPHTKLMHRNERTFRLTTYAVRTLPLLSHMAAARHLIHVCMYLHLTLRMKWSWACYLGGSYAAACTRNSASDTLSYYSVVREYNCCKVQCLGRPCSTEMEIAGYNWRAVWEYQRQSFSIFCSSNYRMLLWEGRKSRRSIKFHWDIDAVENVAITKCHLRARYIRDDVLSEHMVYSMWN